MQLIHVIPIARNIGMDSLTYFSATPQKAGSVVFVPLRKKEVPAIVLSSQDITDVKTKIKSADFALKKIVNKKNYDIFLPSFITATQKIADYFATTVGSVLNTTIPKALWDDIGKINITKTKTSKKGTLPIKYILQSEISDRISSYKSLIREEFARKASVFLLVPTMQDAECMEKSLQKGVEQYTIVLHGKLTKKEMLLRWKYALNNDHPVLIIATGLFLSLPRNDIQTIIIERENSRAYKQLTKPFLDIRLFAEFFAKEKGIKVIFSDLPLQVETMWRYYENELDEFGAVKQRTIRTAEQSLVDMKSKENQEVSEFKIISDELKNLIQHTLHSKKNIFILTARRGLASSIVCLDCGSAVSCIECDSPVVLHSTTKGNLFICHSCGSARSADERCATCASWKLKTIGIGIQLIEEVLQEFFPEEKIFVVDKDRTKTHKQTLETVSKFYNNNTGAILLGTEMVLPYLRTPIDYTAVATLDSLFFLPEWRVSEKILSLLLKMKEITINKMLIQTRKSNNKIFDIVKKGNLTNFYKDEIEKRKQFEYPPYNTFIKITVVGMEEYTSKQMNYLKELLKDFDIQIYPSSIKTGGRKYTMHGLIRVKRNDWRKDTFKTLLTLLRSLPPYFLITVDPESLF